MGLVQVVNIVLSIQYDVYTKIFHTNVIQYGGRFIVLPIQYDDLTVCAQHGNYVIQYSVLFIVLLNQYGRPFHHECQIVKCDWVNLVNNELWFRNV